MRYDQRKRLIYIFTGPVIKSLDTIIINILLHKVWNYTLVLENIQIATCIDETHFMCAHDFLNGSKLHVQT